MQLAARRMKIAPQAIFKIVENFGEASLSEIFEARKIINICQLKPIIKKVPQRIMNGRLELASVDIN